MKDDEKLLGCFGAVIASLFIIVVGSFMNGWTLSVLWGWFVVSVFDVPSLTIMQALGIGLVVSYFSQDLKRQEQKSDKSSYATQLIYACLLTVIKPIVFIVIGWIYLQFM